MPQSKRRSVADLRATIDKLPRHTREAMLEGVARNQIIVGAYVTRDGGVCPMLAAHRCGGRTDFIGFARAWDRFTHAKRARRATPREVLVLVSHLEASLLADDRGGDLAAAVAEHRELVARRPADDSAARAVRPGDPDRSAELAGRRGWAWLRPLRRYDDYERALARVREQVAETHGVEPDDAERDVAAR